MTWIKINLISLFLLLIMVSTISCRDTNYTQKNQEKIVEGDSKEMDRPNIIFLLADDQRADALSFAGNTILQTPNIDKLAAQGMYFENAYVTTSICAVSRASILSGQYARRHDIWGFNKSFTSEQLAQTYPLILRGNGYKTGFIGKYGVGGPLPSDKYDYWEGFGGQGTFNQTDSAGNYIHLTEKIGNQIEDFIEIYKNDSNQFCLSVSFKAPHVEGDPGYFNPDPKYADLYSEDKVEKPIAAADEYFNHFPEEFIKNNVARNRWSSRFANSVMFQENAKKYYQSVFGIDVVVGRLLKKLEDAGLSENTVIIYTSDNGFYLGEYGFAGKWYGSEPSIKVPMILYDPRVGQPKAMRVTGFALNIDLAPTMLSLAGLDVPSEMQGKNLYDLTRGDGKLERRIFL